jgi:hypothetical protein
MRSTKETVPTFFESGLRSCFLQICVLMLTLGAMLLPSTRAFAQADQGAITGTVLDPQERVVASAQITITEVDTGFTASIKTNHSGYYEVSPLKIGHYSVTCSAPGFKTETESGLMLNVNDRLGVNFHLTVGQTTEQVTVQASDIPLLQTEDSSTGLVASESVINDTPLNQRNYVFIAQLAAGVAQTPPGYGRGQGNGDFDANGVGPYQNNFILDGVDNNTSSIDFLNNASYVIKPPPDALAEFKVQTSNYSAELGHGGGAVINASIKSGTNAFHGDAWEYFRNDDLDANNAFAVSKAEYRQNQFGATVGGPVMKNHLFFFGDFEENRIIIGNTTTASIPTLRMRTGDFSELLNPALTGQSAPITIYNPGSVNTPVNCGGSSPNVFCANQISNVALHIFNMMPTPNGPQAADTYNNYVTNVNQESDTAQWDARMDWNVNARDQAFARFSYSNNPTYTKDPYGSILDGGGYGTDGASRLKAEDLALSETHVFSPTLSNELRFSFMYNDFNYGIENENVDIAPTIGLGGIPFSPGQGGMPWITIAHYQGGSGQKGGVGGGQGGGDIGPDIGAGCCSPVYERENNGELRDNLTKISGKHALKIGFQFEKVRSEYFANAFPRGWEIYTGLYTSQPGNSNSGDAEADFLADEQELNVLSTAADTEQYRWYSSGYLQDDWKVTQKLTVNLGLRYDHFMPFEEKHDRQANFIPTSSGLPLGLTYNSTTGNWGGGSSTSSAVYSVPQGSPANLSNPVFQGLLAANNVSLNLGGSRTLSTYQELNFAPRVGFAYQVLPKTVVRGAYGIFFGGLENAFGTNLGQNYPWVNQPITRGSHYTTTTTPCSPGNPNATTPPLFNPYCDGDGVTLENGFATQIANGLQNLPVQAGMGLSAFPAALRTPYAEMYNLSVQEAIRPDLTATVGYVGTQSRHLQETNWNINSAWAMSATGTNNTPFDPFPGFGSITEVAYIGSGGYNSLQAALEKRYSQGLYLTATYTYSHSIDDVLGDLYPQNSNLIPLALERGNSDFDQRHRLSLNGNYKLPVGVGRQFLNHKGIAEEIVGGWSLGVMFAAQTGQPVNVTPSNDWYSTSVYGRAVKTGNPFKGGNQATNSGNTSCPATVKNKANWYNPCAFSNPPLDPSTIAPGTLLTTTAEVLPYTAHGRNQVMGPGYNNLNTSVFKRFSTFDGQYAEFRADIFDTFNTVTLGQPGGGINPGGAQITGARSLGANNPTRRFVQLALKYVF